MRVLLPAGMFAVVGALTMFSMAWAQTTTTTTSFGSGSSSSMGLGSSSGSSLGSSSGSSGAFGSRSLGQGVSAGTRSSFGGTGSGAGGMGGTSGTPGAPNSNIGTSGATFMQSAQRGGFVGARSGDPNNVLGGVMTGQNQRGQQGLQQGLGRNSLLGQNTFGRQGFNQLGGNRLGMQGGMFGGMFGGGATAPRQIQTSVRVAFDYPALQVEKVSTAASQRMTQMPGLHARSPLTVAIQDGTATLRGVVATENDRAVAERVARLEPGVRRVKNELQVASASEE